MHLTEQADQPIPTIFRKCWTTRNNRANVIRKYVKGAGRGGRTSLRQLEFYFGASLFVCYFYLCLFPSAFVCLVVHFLHFPPRRGAADAEIKVPSGENTKLTRSPFKAWSRLVYSNTCYAYCQGFLPCLFLPFRSIHLHFFQNLSRFLLCWLWLTLVPV